MLVGARKALTKGHTAALGAQGGKNATCGGQRRFPVELSFDELAGQSVGGGEIGRGWSRGKEDGIACKKACKM